MASKIRVLDDHTINKIAAGEVIENPASVVKELLENALDAGSSEITIEVQAGGRLLIRISDNGSGMGRDDALLSLERHATSKLKALEDLNELMTMGFRGEAIPSIAAVSKFSLLTSLDGVEGTLIRVEGGKITYCGKGAREKGTTVEVRDLFFNVPVRKKFQRSLNYDELEIIKAVNLEALAHPEIKFQLIINQKPELLAPPADFWQRIKGTLGDNFVSGLVAVEKSDGDFHLTGYIGNPHSHKHNRLSQYLFINNRPVHSNLISHFIKEAYATHIPVGRHPAYCLKLEMPPSYVDVNVHPQKKEVRLRQEESLKRMLYLAVQEALGRDRTPREWNFEPVSVLPWENSYVPPPLPPKPVQEEIVFTPPPEIPKIVTTVKGYILTEARDKEGLNLIDQGRAHARILFERIEKENDSFSEKEALLIPLIIELPKADFILLKEHLPNLQSMGFEIREFGPLTFAVDAYPLLFKQDAVVSVIHSYLTEIKEHNSSSLKDKSLRQKLAEKASYLSVSSEKCLTHDEAERLLSDLMRCQNNLESPLGKPIQVKLSRPELARLFPK